MGRLVDMVARPPPHMQPPSTLHGVLQSHARCELTSLILIRQTTRWLILRLTESAAKTCTSTSEVGSLNRLPFSAVRANWLSRNELNQDSPFSRQAGSPGLSTTGQPRDNRSQ